MIDSDSAPETPTGSNVGVIEVFHADSLAGPMRKLKNYYEARNKGASINLSSGTSKQLAERILKGDRCDVLASSSPAVIEDLMKEMVGPGQTAASWYLIFSANEMVVIVEKGNPFGIRYIEDLAKPDVKFVRVTGDKDLATSRTIEFLNRASSLERRPEVAQIIIDKGSTDPSKPTSVPDVVRAVREGRANAGVVYYSAAVADGKEVDTIRFPDSINMSEAIRNAACVPSNAINRKGGIYFVNFLLTPEAQKILKATGQPPVVPAIRRGNVPGNIGI
ncbi:MAG TPA: extracellular solute-binding protein [Pseudolabrys sp.]|nr:extracellular solute-binding protein [Pseudolabrys sp.]